MNKVIALVFTFVVSLLVGRAVAIDVCQRSELGSLLTNSNTTSCATDSGVVFSSLNGAPSDEQLATICETDTCRSLMAAILVINPEDCTLPLNENLNLMSDLVDPVVEKCTSMGIDITGSSKVGSDSGVNVGDDSAASDSNAQGSSSAATAATSTLVVVLCALLAVVQ
ncbi:Elicitin Vex1 [Phytophthora citrophthora]|uniref:Elicitin n=1 Tax=Phytophthora citrophthora TaxID=4793 RepID=A0AAD9LMR1_9STRA|nr:Elicitin Vex1 [Phytophthora citrophthora]